MNKNEKKSTPFTQPMDTPVRDADLTELYRRLKPDMRRGNQGPDAMAAALDGAQRLAAESDAENAADDMAHELAGDATVVCGTCGYRNRVGNKFCGKCGTEVAASLAPEEASSQAITVRPDAGLSPDFRPATTRPTGNETHHYHHHYHHHYFPGAQDGMYPRGDVAASSGRDEKVRTPNAALRGDMSRAEAGVRAITHEWVLACNTKHLDDLLELYISDALVLRSNHPPIRGAAAVREFFFGALGAGLGEVEIEPLRVEVVGDLAYEAGRCKALIPSSTGKRREERGKYLWVCARQSNGEWKLAADCWSSDLTLTPSESDIPQGAVVKTAQARKL